MGNKRLFLTCFMAMVTTSFGFILRALTLPQWGADFNLTKTQIGEIAGVGLWPFAISIVLFSLVIDRVGYKNAMIFAAFCHISAAILTWFATGYSMLYFATFVMALGNGTVEAVVNPAVATMYPKDRIKWMNMLHAGWPVGLVLGGIGVLLMGPEIGWKWKILLVLIPAIAYTILMLPLKFPVNERVQAGVSYKDMLKQVGVGGALIIVALIVFQLGAVFNWPSIANILITLVITGAFGLYVKSFGQPLYIILLLIMLPLATTELGTDSWITDLMSAEMATIGIQPGWILVYTSAIMAILRMTTGNLLQKISPLILLAICSAIAALGLYLLSSTTGAMILFAATVFALGKAFFWPTMLGVVAEQFPKGGALTLNITGGVGMIGAGVIGAVILGLVQDTTIDKQIRNYDQLNQTNLHNSYITEHKKSVFGDYQALDAAALAKGTVAEQKTVLNIQEKAKKEALRTIVLFPIGMVICYVLLQLYFKSKGGYKVLTLQH